MKTRKARPAPRNAAPVRLRKAPTGINGLDAITEGGLPHGRPTLVCGGPGCGKTMLAMEFLVRGATEFGEAGVFMSFEETADDLVQNVASMGFDLKALESRKRLVIDEVRVSRGHVRQGARINQGGLIEKSGCRIRVAPRCHRTRPAASSAP